MIYISTHGTFSILQLKQSLCLSGRKKPSYLICLFQRHAMVNELAPFDRLSLNTELHIKLDVKTACLFQCCFSYVHTEKPWGLLGTGSPRDDHLDFHSSPELWRLLGILSDA